MRALLLALLLFPGMAFAAPGGLNYTSGPGVTFSDGTHVVLGTQLTFSGCAVGGTSPNATATCSGGGLSSILNNMILANISGSSAVPTGNTLTAIIDAAIGNTRGAILERGASGWAISTPASTAGYAWISNGAGTDPTYQPITNAMVSGSAPLASPAFTGTPTAPTAANGTNTTQVATTAFVLANAGSGGTLPTATAANQPLLSTGAGTTYAAGPAITLGGAFTTSGAYTDTFTLTGNTNVTLPVSGTLAALASPAFTGSPTAPTQTTGDNSTKIATDAFVLANAGVALPTATTSQLYGGTGAAGVAQALTLGTNLSITGTTLNAAGGGGGGNVAPTSYTGNQTMTSANCGTVIESGDATAVTYTFPTEAAGCTIKIIQGGAGQILISGSGVTPHNFSGNTHTGGQYARAEIFYDTTTTLILAGTTAP